MEVLPAWLHKAVVMEDNTSAEQLRLIAQLNNKDKFIMISITNTMLTKQKFQKSFGKILQQDNKKSVEGFYALNKKRVQCGH